MCAALGCAEKASVGPWTTGPSRSARGGPRGAVADLHQDPAHGSQALFRARYPSAADETKGSEARFSYLPGYWGSRVLLVLAVRFLCLCK